MSDEQDQRGQNLIDSLLKSLYETDTKHAQELVSAGMARLEERDTSPRENKVSRSSFRVPKWLAIALATAAMLCIAISIPMFDSSRSAMAAVTQSLNQALQDIGRHYVVNSKLRFSSGDTKTYKVDLYVKGGEQFALKVPGPLRRTSSVWVGSNRENSWAVSPIGPVLEGNRRNLSEWFDRRNNNSTPYLHITTALELMSELYDLQSLPDEDFVAADGNTVRCRRVSGSLKGGSSNEKPDEIALWAKAESGVAMKIVATWDLEPGQAGRESLTIVLQKEINLGDEFFTPENHGGSGRRRLNFSNEN